MGDWMTMIRKWVLAGGRCSYVSDGEATGA